MMPVMVVHELEHAVPLAAALLEGGISVFEVTLRTKVGLAAISKIKEAFPESTVGVGTVANAQDLQQSVAAGAEFIISPGITDSLLDCAVKSDVPIIPGVSTVSELMTCLERGINAMKFFPAEASGGVKTLKAFAGPFPDVAFCPTGGIGPKNIADYLALPSVYTVGGSWVLPDAAVKAQDWQQITDLTRAAVQLIAELKEQSGR
jgi:2-dehydro-3-deoxyphosphogluconate aldolase/(4S)-4-hydroxy-2-oxoglutarate aldolase